MAEKKCPLCGAMMAFDDFTHAWVCSECGKSIADNTDSASKAPSPDAPAAPAVPASPEVHTTPVTSAAPAAPSTPNPPAASTAPAAPAVPASPEVHTTPVTSAAPAAPSTPNRPAASPARPAPATPGAPARGIRAFAAASAPRTRATSAKDAPSKGPGPGYETITKARSLIAERQFEQALKLLYDLKKRNLQIARSYILSMLCSYQVCTMPDLLTKLSGSSVQLQKFADRPDWQIISKALPSSRRVFVSDVIEFCVLTIALMGDAKKVIHRAANKNSPHLSSISRMDAEDVHNELRMRDMKKAKAAGYKTFQEIAEDYAERIWNDTDLGSPIPVEDPTPEAAHNLLPKSAQGSIVVESLRKLENTPLPEEDLKARRSQLFSRIGEYEQEILLDTSKDISTERK